MCLVTLQGAGKFEITQSKYRLSEEQKHDEGQLLFDFCAECLKKFTDSNIESGVMEKGVVYPLGFTVRMRLSVIASTFSHTPHSVLISLLVRPFLRFSMVHVLTIHFSQVRIDHGELIRWTKGFNAANTEGHDVVAMFRKSLVKHVR